MTFAEAQAHLVFAVTIKLVTVKTGFAIEKQLVKDIAMNKRQELTKHPRYTGQKTRHKFTLFSRSGRGLSAGTTLDWDSAWKTTPWRVIT